MQSRETLFHFFKSPIKNILLSTPIFFQFPFFHIITFIIIYKPISLAFYIIFESFRDIKIQNYKIENSRNRFRFQIENIPQINDPSQSLIANGIFLCEYSAILVVCEPLTNFHIINVITLCCQREMYKE